MGNEQTKEFKIGFQNNSSFLFKRDEQFSDQVEGWPPRCLPIRITSGFS